MMDTPEETINVPEELRHFAVELITTYLTEEPKDFVEYGLRFFKKKILNRTMGRKGSFEEVIDSRRLAQRRSSIYSESFDPESDFKPAVYKKTFLQKKSLVRAVKDSVIFEALDDVDLIQLVNAMQGKSVKKDEYVIRQGDKGDYLYIIEKGIFEAVNEDGVSSNVLHVYRDEGSFGELALLHNTPRACSVIARSDGYLWALDRKTFRHIVLGNQLKKKKRHDVLIEKVPMLSNLPAKQKAKLVDALVSRTYKSGEKIIREGDISDGMYFIESGRARVTVKCYATSREEEIKRLKAGDYFGEFGPVMKQPRAASVYAVGRTTVAFLNTQALERLLGPCIKLMKRHFSEYKKQIKEIQKVN